MASASLGVAFDPVSMLANGLTGGLFGALSGGGGGLSLGVQAPAAQASASVGVDASAAPAKHHRKHHHKKKAADDGAGLSASVSLDANGNPVASSTSTSSSPAQGAAAPPGAPGQSGTGQAGPAALSPDQVKQIQDDERKRLEDEFFMEKKSTTLGVVAFSALGIALGVGAVALLRRRVL